MMKNRWQAKLKVVLAGFALIAGVSSAALVDDFEGYSTGLVRDVASPPWVAVENTSFASIEAEDTGNQYLTYGWSGGYRGAYRPISPVSNTNTATTLFVRVCAASDNVDHSFGLSDLATPGWFDDYEVQIAILENAASGVVDLAGRNAGTAQRVVQLNVGQWYNVWVVIDQTTDRYDIYVTDGSTFATEANKVASGFAFRNGTIDDLVTFFAFGIRGQNVRLDDIHLFDGVMLAHPNLIVAHDPSPTNGATAVPLETVLSWKTSVDPNAPDQVNPNITHHYLYFRDDPNFAGMTEPTAIIEADGPTASYEAQGLLHDKTYYWRVDEILNNGPASDPNFVIPGRVWRFNTILSVPVLRQDITPKMVFADSGQDVAFVVEYTSFSPAFAVWYKYVDGVNDEVLTDEFGIPFDPSRYAVENDGTSKTTLTVLNATEDDQAQYYCIIANMEQGQLESGRASLIIKKLLAHYPFEDDFVDLVNATSGIGLNYPDANLPGPSFVDGIDGRAAWFAAGNYVDLGTEAFPKAGTGNGMEAATLSVWVNPTVAGNLMANFNDNNAEGIGTTGFGFSLAGSQPRIIVRGEPVDGAYYEMGTLQAGGSPVGIGDEQWYLVTTTWQAGDHMKLYVNGVEVASMTGVGTPQEFKPWQYGVLLGAARSAADRTIPTVGYAGGMDDLRVFNYPLDKFEIAQLYYETSGIGLCINEYASSFDFNGDCRVDMEDFVLFAAEWLTCGRYPLEACE